MFFPKPNVVCILGPDWNGVSSFTRQIQLLGTKERKTSVLNPNIFWLPMAFKLNNPKSMRPKQDLRRACSAHPVHGSLPGKEHVRGPNYDIIQCIQNLSFESPHSKTSILMNCMWNSIVQLKCYVENVLQLHQKSCFFLIEINHWFAIHISHDMHDPLLKCSTAPTLWGSSSGAWHRVTNSQDPWINWHSQMGLG